jgi:UDP-4-amino-4,6-dideoxy-N-acetyl-beta-L-altrosamine transaminase
MIPYGKQHITKEDIEAVLEALQSDFLTQGPKISEFEEKFASYIGSKYAVAVANGTAALHLCALALGVNENSKVLTVPNTFVASANCVLYCGGEVDFVDIDPNTFTISIPLLKEKLESKPKGYYSGVIPVNFAGYPVNLEEVKEIANEYGLWILEDSCHSPGASFKKKNGEWSNSGSGEFADLSIFSFHPVKHIATGEGGMITTNNKRLFDKLNILRTHGITKNPDFLKENHGGWYYEMQTLGYNYRLPDILAALGVSQLNRAAQGLEKRRELAEFYNNELKGVGDLLLPNVENNVHHAYHLYVIRTNRRKELYDYLRAQNIFCQVHYIPVHLQPFYQEKGFKVGDFPESEDYYNTCLSLPMYPSITEEEKRTVLSKIKEFYN